MPAGLDLGLAHHAVRASRLACLPHTETCLFHVLVEKLQAVTLFKLLVRNNEYLKQTVLKLLDGFDVSDFDSRVVVESLFHHKRRDVVKIRAFEILSARIGNFQIPHFAFARNIISVTACKIHCFSIRLHRRCDIAFAAQSAFDFERANACPCKLIDALCKAQISCAEKITAIFVLAYFCLV